MNKNRVGLIFGSFMALFHLIWSLMVLIGVAQTFYDFIFWLHMISLPWKVTGFTLTQAISLIVVTFAIGYFMGYMIAWLWNKFNKKQ
ncbi:MAG: hypothetical protein WA101_01955 [Minisyncoccia bacterium]